MRAIEGDIGGLIVAQAATGDELAFARIVAAHHDDMARVAFVVCHDVQMAHEAAHAAWPLAWWNFQDQPFETPRRNSGCVFAGAGHRACRRAACPHRRRPGGGTVIGAGCAQGAGTGLGDRHLRLAGSCVDAEVEAADGLLRERGWQCTPQEWVTSDPRLDGASANTWNADVWLIDGALISLRRATYDVVNEGAGGTARTPTTWPTARGCSSTPTTPSRSPVSGREDMQASPRSPPSTGRTSRT